MKKFLIGLSILGLTNLAYPHDPASGKSTGKAPSTNTGYINSVRQKITDGGVLGLQEMAAGFDLKHSDFFVTGYRTHDITFRKGSRKIDVTYDNQGKILYTSEKYTNVILPSPVRNNIWRDYQGCNVLSNTCQITYKDGRTPKVIYKVWIAKDGLKKRLKIDAEGRFI